MLSNRYNQYNSLRWVFTILIIFLAVLSLNRNVLCKTLSFPVNPDAVREKEVSSFPSKEVQGGGINETIKAQVQESYGKLPLYFIQNDGQVDERVKYYEKGSGHATYFTKEGVYLLLGSSKQGAGSSGDVSSESSLGTQSQHSYLPSTLMGEGQGGGVIASGPDLVKLAFLNANKNPEIIAIDQQDGKVNYFIGNDPDKWKTNIPTYKAVLYKEVYPGIDIKFYGNNRQLEYDIIVKSGADPTKVKFAYAGIEGLGITEDGDLEIRLKEDIIIQKRPYIYQEINDKKVEVAGRFNIINDFGNLNVNRISKGEVAFGQGFLSMTGGETSVAHDLTQRFIYSFDIVSYDKNYPLVIDPLLVYSTFIGGSDYDRGFRIAVDDSGNAFVTGYTGSTNFPTTISAYDTSHNGGSDVFIAKINSTGSALIYSTFIGGNGSDKGFDIAVDTSGNAYVMGETWSTNFPTTASAYDTSHNGGSDVFIAKLNSAGSALTYSTFLGGSSYDYGDGIALDESGNSYVSGHTGSTNFPTTTVAYDRSHNGSYDAFVAKLNPTGSALTYSTFLGGSDDEWGDGIALDVSGNAYVTGRTLSTNFPTTVSAFDRSHNGNYDAFIVKLNSTGSALTYSTFIGGSNDDIGYGIILDVSGNAYVTGYTGSTNFPTTISAYDTNHNGGYDAFIAKLNSTGSVLTYSTFLGGSDYDYGWGIALDKSDNIYVTGDTSSFDFPVTSSAYDSSYNGTQDVFVIKLNLTNSTLVYSTFLGGFSLDQGIDIALDTSDNAYITGYAYSPNFPITTSAYDTTQNGNYDAFIVKLSFIAFPSISGKVTENGMGLSGVNMVLSGPTLMNSTTGVDGSYSFANLIDGNYTITPEKTGYTFTPINRNVKVTGADIPGQDFSASKINNSPVLDSIGSKSVNEGVQLSFTVSGSDIDGDVLTYSAEGLPAGATFDSTTRTFSWMLNFSQVGSYNVTFSVSDGLLSDSEVVTIVVNNVNQTPLLNPVGNKSVEEGSLLQFTITASDPDGDAITFTATGIPTWAGFNSATAQFSGTPGFTDAGSLIITFTASDGSLTASEAITITVNNKNMPPVMNPIGSKSILEGSTLSFVINASDTDEDDTLTYSASSLPPGATFDSSSRIFSYTPDFDVSSENSNSFFDVFFEVSDGHNAKDSIAVQITVIDVPSDTFIQLPRTGQTTCYDTDGLVVSCTGTGHDGDLQIGVSLPDPRFKDNGNGTVIDNLTGLMWPTNANLSDKNGMAWQQAIDYVAGMNAGIYPNFGFTDWRLPNLNELESLVDYERGAPVLSNGHPFTNIKGNYYWSSTTVASSTSDARFVHMGLGQSYNGVKSTYLGLVWPVRTEQIISTIQLPQTGQITCYDTSGNVIPCAGTGQDAFLRAGISWPTIRFTDNGNDTITDNLTALVWTKNADLPVSDKNWQEALDYVSGMNAGIYPNFGYTDWRLPNIAEIKSLIDAGQFNPALPNDNPFNNVKTNYWSSTSDVYTGKIAWAVSMSYGYINSYPKLNWPASVLPVRTRGPNLNSNFISGKIMNNGIGLSGVSITLSGDATSTTTTQNDGAYILTNLTDGSYSISPKKDGFTFDPPSRSVTISGKGRVSEDFNGVSATVEDKGNEKKSGTGSGGCFIATAAFGSYLDPHVEILREFREQVLLKTGWGSHFVNFYYTYSPPIAKLITRHEVLRGAVRAGLLPIIGIAWIAVNMQFYQQAVLVLLFLTIGILIYKRQWFKKYGSTG